jgi:glyoxylase-like metal-dependent hydrolase (beta-lactamase superfamily II)
MDFDVGNGAWLRVVETLGHASHHLSFYESLNGGIFPGDAAGIYLNEFDVVVPTTPSPFCLEIALSSLDKLANLKPRALYYSHFGEAGEAVKRLQDYKSQIKSWANIVKDGMRKKQSLDFIRKRILAEDENMRKIAPFLRAHPIYVKTVIQNSVQGFVDWVEESEN